MANPSAAHEPSMEEILASIRQIISEDGEGSEPSDDLRAQGKGETSDGQDEAAAEDAEPEAASSFSEDVEEASEPVAESHAEMAADPETTLEHDHEPESGFAHGESMTPQYSSAEAEAEPYAATTPASAAQSGEDNLLSPQSDTAVHGAFSALAHTILAQNARTLEDLVAEMLQPMLKNWLDENLPALVEQMVHEEIQRVSRGRR